MEYTFRCPGGMVADQLPFQYCRVGRSRVGFLKQMPSVTLYWRAFCPIICVGRISRGNAGPQKAPRLFPRIWRGLSSKIIIYKLLFPRGFEFLQALLCNHPFIPHSNPRFLYLPGWLPRPTNLTICFKERYLKGLTLASKGDGSPFLDHNCVRHRHNSLWVRSRCIWYD